MFFFGKSGPVPEEGRPMGENVLRSSASSLKTCVADAKRSPRARNPSSRVQLLSSSSTKRTEWDRAAAGSEGRTLLNTWRFTPFPGTG
jgi:hypothetical protein